MSSISHSGKHSGKSKASQEVEAALAPTPLHDAQFGLCVVDRTKYSEAATRGNLGELVEKPDISNVKQQVLL